MNVRKRNLNYVLPPGVMNVDDYWGGSHLLNTQKAPGRTFLGTQVTESEGHPFNSRNKRGFTGDVGGPFFTQKSYLEGSIPTQSMTVVKNVNGILRTRKYSGPIIPCAPNLMSYPSIPRPSDLDLDKKGATAVANCAPTNSVASAGVALTELYRDGLPALVGHQTWKSRTLRARNAGEEYLNVEFGFKPLASDISSFATAVSQASAVMRQYERDAGKMVRRSYEFPTEQTQSFEKMAPVDVFYEPGDSTFGPNGDGGYTAITTKTVKRCWFSGAFTYHLPSGYDSRNAMDRYALEAKKLFGLQLTPYTVWSVAPWSWAVDWFTNTGDVLKNLSMYATDGLVMRYGYVMMNIKVIKTYTRVGSSSLDGTNPLATPVTLVTEIKMRRPANPFGFGITWNGLSPRQLAIAGALGITRR